MNTKTRFSPLHLAAALALAAAPGIAFAQAAQRFVPYKGQLERDGLPYTGTVTVVFSLWDALVGGQQMHTETRQVIVTGGNFAVQVGPVPELAFASPSLYLAMSVDGVTLGGRQLLQTSPYAVRGQPGLPFRVDQLIVSSNGGEATIGVDPGTNRLDIPGPADVGGDLAVGGNITLGGALSTPRLGAFSPVANSNQNHFGPGFLQSTFLDWGGTILIHASATAYCATQGRIQMRLTVDGLTVANMRLYCHSTGTHLAFPSTFSRLDRNIFAAPAPGANTTRTVRLEPVNCPPGQCTSPLVTTLADANDFGEITVVRLPTPF